MSGIVEDYRNSKGKWVRSFTCSGDRVITRSGTRRMNMAGRCRVDGAEQKRTPSYKGCSMSPDFRDFQLFTEWHVEQVGYEQMGYQLDKDLLVDGNKEYSRSVCVLIPQKLNSFLVGCGKLRGEYAQGVSFDKSRCLFAAHISGIGELKNLGRFKTEDEAYAAYKSAKEAVAHRWYERLFTGEFIVDTRVIERMRTWRLEE